LKNLYNDYMKALNHPGSPVLFLDLDAFEKNIQWVKENSGGKKIRIATKSLRSKDVLKKILEHDSIFQGLMTYDLREALWLRSQGFQDILMGYPSVDVNSLKILAENPQGITLMVDLPEHLKLIQKLASEKNSIINVCVDIDMSYDLPGLRFGVYRSSIHRAEHLKNFLEVLKSCNNICLTGLMGYEAQIAGVMDKNSPLIRFLKHLSIKSLQRRRKEMVQLIHDFGIKLKFVNGGGTGSLSSTRTEEDVTEITVGSGFYSPVLFDHYKGFKLNPALMFTLPIVRQPDEKTFTCQGGGYIASGATEKIKQPEPYLPEGLKLLKHEGAGEVQTPLHYAGPEKLQIGSSIIMRHAKSGEVCERFEKIELIRKGKVESSISTYRGEGKNFV
jgi:D-serine deaminase-like pyridoxal phosphate-dependent protein